MKKNISALLLLSTLSIALIGCTPNVSSSSISSSNSSSQSTTSNSSTTTSIQGENGQILANELADLLEGDIYDYEIANSSKTSYSGSDDREYSVQITDEIWTTYKDGTAYASGSSSMTYEGEDQPSYVDTYKKLVTTETVYDVDTNSSVTVAYFITDYAKNGNEYQPWSDSATRLPVVASGNSSLDGVEYLLESSLPGQLSKQVSLISANYISTMLSNAQDYIPYVSFVKNGNVTTYTLENFIFESDGLTYTYNFVIVVDGLKIITSELNLIQSEPEVDGTTYSITLSDVYNVSYDERTNFSDSGIVMNPRDYFLAEVVSARAYYYDNGFKTYVELNNLPLGKYILFEAFQYLPSLAVDLELYPVFSSNTSSFQIDNNVIYVADIGVGEIVLESLTGATISVDVATTIPDISNLTYADSSSNIEKEYVEGPDGEEVLQRNIYVGQTYTNIYVSVEPFGSLTSDVGYSVSDPNVLQISSQVYSSSIMFTYTVLNDNESHEVSVTFYSLTNPEVSTTVTYKIKDALTDDERIEILMSTTYHWQSLYDSFASADLTFTSSSNAHLVLYFDGEIIDETDFTYSLDGTILHISNLSNPDYYYPYNGGSVKLDCSSVTLTVNDYETVHNFYPTTGDLTINKSSKN